MKTWISSPLKKPMGCSIPWMEPSKLLRDDEILLANAACLSWRQLKKELEVD